LSFQQNLPTFCAVKNSQEIHTAPSMQIEDKNVT